MKKRYSVPAVAITEIYTNNFIASSPQVSVGEDVENGTTGAAPQKGEWGNLWK